MSDTRSFTTRRGVATMGSWSRVSLMLGLVLVLLSYQTESAPAKESESDRLANALLRLDDALDTLSSYFKDTRHTKESTKDVKKEEDAEEEIDEPKPEIPEKEDRGEDAGIMENQDGARPEITAELEDMSEKELAEVPGGQTPLEDEDDEERQEAVLRAALRYLLKVQKQERRQKKDYDIPFPIFSYKRGPNNE